VIEVAGAKAVAFDARGELLVGTRAGVKRGGITLGGREVTELAVDRERKQLVVGAIVQESYRVPSWVEIWNLDTNELVHDWKVADGTIHVAIAGDVIATGGELGECIVWNADGTKRFEHSMKGPVWGVALSADGVNVAFGSESGMIMVRSALDGDERKRYRVRAVWTLSFGPDDALAVSGADTVAVLTPTRRRLEFPEQNLDTEAHAWMPDGSIVVATRNLHALHHRIYRFAR
jgi:hypothetical protein